MLLLPILVFGRCDIYGSRTRDWKCKGSNYERCSGRVDSGIIGGEHWRGWIPQLWAQGEWFLLKSVGGHHLPCFTQSAQGWPIWPKPGDPISDPILDPDSCWRECPHHSTLRNRIQNWISKSDPKLDPSISVLGGKSDAKLDSQIGHAFLCIIGRTSGHPIGPGFGFCLGFNPRQDTVRMLARLFSTACKIYCA